MAISTLVEIIIVFLILPHCFSFCNLLQYLHKTMNKRDHIYKKRQMKQIIEKNANILKLTCDDLNAICLLEIIGMFSLYFLRQPAKKMFGLLMHLF